MARNWSSYPLYSQRANCEYYSSSSWLGPNQMGLGQFILHGGRMREDCEIGNLVPASDLNETKLFQKRLLCCKCPECNAIFTLFLENPNDNWTRYGSYYSPCPSCKLTRNWMFNTISKTKFKFIRYWRQTKAKYKRKNSCEDGQANQSDY